MLSDAKQQRLNSWQIVTPGEVLLRLHGRNYIKIEDLHFRLQKFYFSTEKIEALQCLFLIERREQSYLS